MAKLYLLFGVHNHQPVGNFDKVFAQAYHNCYLPFFKILSEFKEVKCNVHFSGCLFDWLKDNQKEEMFDILKALSGSGQIEILSGGYYEPILSLIPRSDRQGQIKYMNEFIRTNFAFSPRGLWLTERVWEQEIAADINACGLDYTLVDDTHFRYAGIMQDNFFGYYLTESEAKKIAVFPISKLLRYNVPFSTLDSLRSLLWSLRDEKEDRLITIMDDGEKFGLWPHTYEWVYEKRWLEGFFQLLTDNKDWVEAITFSQALEKFSPQGIVYLPNASYAEMMEWVLEKDAYDLFKEVKKKTEHVSGADTFLRGGYFRNFLRKYPEINHMHKRMFMISRNLWQKRQENPAALKRLWMAQCNCAWWHGVFGGFYLGHLRDAVYQNLLAAEKIAEESTASLSFLEEDFNLDGEKEVVLQNASLNLFVAPACGGRVEEIDLKEFLLNLSNTITRRRENYHLDMKKKKADLGKNPKSIHDLVTAKEKDLDKYLIYDSYRKASLIEGLVPKNAPQQHLKEFGLQKNFSHAPASYQISQSLGKLSLNLSYRAFEVGVEKKIELAEEVAGAKFSYRFVCGNEELIEKEFLGIEFNFFIPSLDDSYYSLKDKNFSLFQESFLPQADSLYIIDKFRKFRLELSFPPAQVAVNPVYSVSSSEGGFEKNLQQICVVLLVDLAFSKEYEINFKVKKHKEGE